MANSLRRKAPLSKFQAGSPKARLQFTVVNFEGMNNNDDPSSIDDNMSPDALNVVFDSVGSVQTRKGYIKLLTTTLGAAISGIRPLYKSDGITKQLVYWAGQNFYRYDNAGGSVQINTAVMTNGRQWDSDAYFDKLFAGNGVDGLFSYDYSSWSIVTGAGGITPQYVRTHKNRIWAANANSSRIYFSNAGDPTTWPVNNFIDINTNDGQVITGIEELLDALIVFKTDSIWIITGEPLGAGNTTTIGNLQLRKANSDVGCVAFRTIVKVESALFFMARSGVYVFQNYQTKLISQTMNNTFRNMNLNFQSAAWAVYSTLEKKYVLGFPDGAATTSNKALVFDLILRGWSVWDDIPGSCGCNFRFNQTDTTLFGDPNKGIIYKAFTGYADIAGDNGQASGAGSTTTLVDTSKAWTVNQFVDAKVYISAGVDAGQTAVIVSNTSNTLTFSPALTNATDGSCVYTIGGYSSYWKTKIFDFQEPEMVKKYKYWDIFADSSGNYNLQVGMSQGYSPLAFNLTPVSLGVASWNWDQVAPVWDQPNGTYFWDPKASLFKRINIAGQNRLIQLMFGNYNSNQPWRVISYVIQFKEKKARPS